MIAEHVVDLSRFQFAATALYHFLFVPLTLGMAFILAIMESVYVMTNNTVYRDMTKFWGKLFGINFALGVTTGLTMEFQFGTNWAYYSHYVGDIFGAPLAIEGLMAFFLESTFVGMFFFGWDRLTKRQHLAATWLMALGTNLSALWILVANGWMQNPVGAEFNFESMRMEMVSFAELVFNPVAQVKFVHTVAAGYTTGAMFVLGISSYYLLKNRDVAFARRSFAIAAAFGMASILSVLILGDESGYETGEVQKVKLAAIEAEWNTEPAPASFTLFGIPNQEEMRTDYAIKIPYALGIIATRSLDGQVTGLKDLKSEHELRVRSGMTAYDLLTKLQSGDKSDETRARFDEVKQDLGYGLLLKRYTANVTDATDEQIWEAARAANAEAFRRLTTSEPVLVDVRPAIEVVPGMTARGLGHIGAVEVLQERGHEAMMQDWRFYAFAEGAQLYLRDELPDQDANYALASVGLGTRASLSKWLSGSLDWGYPLLEGPNTSKQESRLHFNLQATF